MVDGCGKETAALTENVPTVTEQEEWIFYPTRHSWEHNKHKCSWRYWGIDPWQVAMPNRQGNNVLSLQTSPRRGGHTEPAGSLTGLGSREVKTAEYHRQSSRQQRTPCTEGALGAFGLPWTQGLFSSDVNKTPQGWRKRHLKWLAGEAPRVPVLTSQDETLLTLERCIQSPEESWDSIGECLVYINKITALEKCGTIPSSLIYVWKGDLKT